MKRLFVTVIVLAMGFFDVASGGRSTGKET